MKSEAITSRAKTVTNSGPGRRHADVAAVDLALGPPELGSGGEVPQPRRSWWSSVVVADVVSLGASFALGAWARQPLGPNEGPGVAASMAKDLPYLPVFLLTMAIYGLYQTDKRRLRAAGFTDIGPRGHALGVGAALTVAIAAGLHRVAGVTKVGWVEAFFMTLPAAALVPMARSALKSIGGKKLTRRSRVIILGSGSVAASLARRLSRYNDIQLVGFVDDDPYVPPGISLPRHIGRLAELPQICARTRPDRVLVAFSQSSPEDIAVTLRALPSTVRVSVVPRLFELVTWQSQIEELHGLTLLDIAPPCLGLVSRAIKRTMDILGALLALTLLGPAMLVIAVAIKATSRGPVFFRQDRVGYRGQTFRMFKFRTMEVGAERLKIDLRERNEVDGPLFKLHDDPRVTRVGRALRPRSLDELPQLFNVLLGDMSLVGPRPFVPNESAGIDGWAARRFEVKPGMTGLWQVSGRNDLPFEELRQLDYAYVASWSIWWDLKILWHTPGSVLRRHGAY